MRPSSQALITLFAAMGGGVYPDDDRVITSKPTGKDAVPIEIQQQRIAAAESKRRAKRAKRQAMHSSQPTDCLR